MLARAQEAIALLNHRGQLLALNDLALEILQLPESQLIGRPWKDLVSTSVDFARLHRGAQPLETYTSVRRLGGRSFGAWQSQPLPANLQQQVLEWSLTREVMPRRHLVIFREIGHRLTQAEVALAQQQQQAELFAEVTLKIRQSLQLAEILHTTVTEVQRLLGADRVLVYQVLPDGTGKPISEAVLPDYPKILGMQFPEEVFPIEYQQRYAQGRVVAIAKVRDPAAGLADCLVEFVEQFGIKAKLIVPILQYPAWQSPPAKPAALWGLLIAHQCSQERQWSEAELALMQQLADQISIAIAQSQLVENLEDIVAVRTAALRQQEEQLRLITNALPVLISYVDRNQCYRFNNQAYEDWLGQPLETLKGKHLQEVWGKDCYGRMQLPAQAVLAGEATTYENEILGPEGQVRSLNVTYIPDFDPQGEVQGFFALTSDISDRKAIERMKDEFISVVSHELRTPLTSMHSALKILSTGRLGLLSQDGQQMLEIADENTERLVRLVNNVLDLQRIESGDVTMEKQICDAASLIIRAMEAMQPMAQQQGIRLTSEPLSIPIWADADYILQTLTNLLSNAIKFSNSGEIVSITVEAQATQTLFRIWDQGPGIPEDKLENIFERFQQVDSSDARRKGGTGLGLTICREIVERHGGKIWAESQPGRGSTFSFTVPSLPQTEGSVAQTSAQTSAESSSGGTDG
ncbi:MAG: PAS domain-containing protein [Synechococcales cyanobacterium CRU_2_2]|nr:PAS domain-containing protein [Synechococcales cyanobacterium CRU_2_2]